MTKYKVLLLNKRSNMTKYKILLLNKRSNMKNVRFQSYVKFPLVWGSIPPSGKWYNVSSKLYFSFLFWTVTFLHQTPCPHVQKSSILYYSIHGKLTSTEYILAVLEYFQPYFHLSFKIRQKKQHYAHCTLKYLYYPPPSPNLNDDIKDIFDQNVKAQKSIFKNKCPHNRNLRI